MKTKLLFLFLLFALTINSFCYNSKNTNNVCDVIDVVVTQDTEVCEGTIYSLEEFIDISDYTDFILYFFSDSEGANQIDHYVSITQDTYYVQVEVAGEFSAITAINFIVRQRPLANAGIDQAVCGNHAQLNAIYSLPHTESYTPCGFWTSLSGTAIINQNTDCDYSNNSALVTVSNYAVIYSFIWTEVNPDISYCSSSDTVQIEFVQNPASIILPPVGELVCGNVATLTASSFPSPTFEGMWSGPGIFSNPTALTTTVENNILGQATYTWTVTNHSVLLTNILPISCYSSSNKTITFLEKPTATITTDENFSNFCGEKNIYYPNILHANPAGNGNFCEWSTLNPSLYFSETSNPNPEISFGNYNQEYEIIWMVGHYYSEPMHVCYSRDTFRITLREIPKITLADSATICGNTISLTGSVIPQNSSTMWTVTDNIQIDSPTNLTSLVSCEEFNGYRNYLITLNADNFGCDTSQSINVTFKELPSTDFTIIPPKCFGEEAILIADTTKYQSYAWDYGTQFPSHERVRYSNTQGGIYSTFVSWEVNPADTINGHEIPHTVTLTVSNNGCTGIPETIDIVEPGVHESMPNITKDTCMHSTGQIILNNNGQAQYYWLASLYTDLIAQGLMTFNSDSTIISNLPYGSYSVQRTYPSTNTDPLFVFYYNSSFGNRFCIDTISFFIPSFEIDVNFFTQECSSATATDGSIEFENPNENLTFQWSNGATTASIYHLGMGTYTVTISNGNCSIVKIIELTHLLGITSINNENKIEISPNPNNGSFTIEINSNENFEKYQIFDVIGTIILDNKITSNLNEINIENIATGIYYIRFISNNNIYTKKIIVN
ncbi:MAG: T9SS type A sorting domain-containing protein [Bacteroidales bacterium]|jgi:hypothetical protein|nr:T9SS type A sorting domain-containing protein [Bacteroidales bacterium]